MKKISILVTAMLFVVVSTGSFLSAQAVYQLPNPGFEQWDNTNLNAEPTQWNSFATSDGTWASLASSPHHYHRNGGRPGTAGSSYLTIYSTSIMGIVANGNMTTGRMHVGSMSASSSDNYNYTQRSNSSHCQPFHGTPDSMYIWVSFYAAQSTSLAQVTAVIHGDNDFRSPNYEDNPAFYCGKAITRFARTTASSSSMTWEQIKVPFVYDGATTPQYMLLSMTTNFNPGAGSANDSLSIDDIEFIYSAWLNGITVNGTPVDGFDKAVFDYAVALADTAAFGSVAVAATAEASDATTEIAVTRLTDSTAVAVIDVTAEDSVTIRQYRISLTAPMPTPEPVMDTVRYTVTVATADSAMGSVSPEGESVVDSASSFTVTATAADGYHFAGWSVSPGYTALISNNPFTFTVVEDMTVVATFEADSSAAETVRYTVTVATADAAMGSVSQEGEFIVDSASVFAVTATPAAGFHFVGWSVVPGYTELVTDNPLTVTVTDNISITALFAADTTSGIVAPGEAPTVAVYPNPAFDKVTVEGDGPMSIADINGRLLKQWQGSATVDLGGLPVGIYMLRCGAEVRKIIKRQ